MASRRRLAARRSRAASLALAWRCPRDPMMRRDACRAARWRCCRSVAHGAGWATRSMVSSAWAMTAHSAPMPRSIPQRPSGSRGPRGVWATIVVTETNSRSPCSLSHRQHPRPALGDQPLQAPGALLAAQLPDHGEDDMATVRFQAHRASVEPDPAAVAAASLEPGEPDPGAGSAALLGCRPGVQGGGQVGDPGAVGFLGTVPPPGSHLFLGLVPSLAERRQRPGQRRHRGIGRSGVQVRLDLGKGPVVGEPPGTEMLADQRPLRRGGCLHLEPPAPRDPAVGDHEPPDPRHHQWPFRLPRPARTGQDAGSMMVVMD